jgi:predicted nuclease of restriction endonuclease-like RecB superfamily
VRSQVHAVARFAKLKRLLCAFETRADGTVVHISGPLSVLRYTTKYGHALAAFLPAVLSTPGWTLEASCAFGKTSRATLSLSAADSLSATHALPRETDSALERRLLADVRALRSGWTIERETTAIDLQSDGAPPRTFYPDFTLAQGDHRIVVEVVGFYTPEYLRAKLKALRSLASRRAIVCVDASFGISAQIPADVLTFRRRIDARELVARAEAMCR